MRENSPVLLGALPVLLFFSFRALAGEPCEQSRVAESQPKVEQHPSIQAVLQNAEDECQDLKGAYTKFKATLRALPVLNHSSVEWEKFFQDNQVLDTSNQMSCVGHSVARAVSLTSLNSGQVVTPSPEFLYDMGESYYKTFLDGDVSALFQDMDKNQRSEQMAQLLRRYETSQSAKEHGHPQYAGAHVALTLDYAGIGVVPSRSAYSQHFQGLNGLPSTKLGLGFVDFPPVSLALQGAVVKCYALNKSDPRQPESSLNRLEEFTATGTHLMRFDFGLVDESLDRGYFPILSINTDLLKVSGDGGEVSYAAGGKNSHAFVVVGKGSDSRGAYYETLDSWADENMKKRDKAFKMRKYKIYQSDLDRKILNFTLVTKLAPSN